jgi:hypothetical protein
MMTEATDARTCCDVSAHSSRTHGRMCSSTSSGDTISLKTVTLKPAAVRTSASPSCSRRTNVGSISSFVTSSPTEGTRSQKWVATTYRTRQDLSCATALMMGRTCARVAGRDVERREA